MQPTILLPAPRQQSATAKDFAVVSFPLPARGYPARLVSLTSRPTISPSNRALDRGKR
jgi:hypothetical protein